MSPIAPRPQHRIAFVVMGVSGSGKSTIGAGLAEALGIGFVDGDGLHVAASVAKMRAGIALGDADRAPWLERIGAELADASQWSRGVGVACSALKRAYRDRLREAAPGLGFVFLDGTSEVIASRLGGRSGHFMPGSLLASQLQTLERPAHDEGDLARFDIALAPDEIVRRASAWLRGRSER